MIAVSISCQVLLTFWKKGEESRQLWQRISWLCLCLPLRTENGKWNDHSCIFFYYINANLVYLLKMCYTVYYYIVFKFNNNHNALFKYTCVFQNDPDCWGRSRWLGEMPYGPHSHLTSLPSSVSLQICPSIQFLASEICVIRIGGSVAERPMIPV